MVYMIQVWELRLYWVSPRSVELPISTVFWSSIPSIHLGVCLVGSAQTTSTWGTIYSGILTWTGEAMSGGMKRVGRGRGQAFKDESTAQYGSTFLCASNDWAPHLHDYPIVFQPLNKGSAIRLKSRGSEFFCLIFTNILYPPIPSLQ